MEAASDVLLGVLARGGAAAALVPSLVKDCLQASPDGATADAATIERVSAWLLASPWELRKCRSFEAALMATAQVLGRGPHPKPAVVAASVTRELAVLRTLLCRTQGDGLTLVRLAALGALESDERKVAQVRLRLKGATLRVTVAVSVQGGEANLEAASAAQRAVDAAELAATPLAVRVPLPEGLSASQLIGRGGLALAQLQREIEEQLEMEEQLDLSVREASTLALSAPTRRTLGDGEGGSVVSMRVGRACVEVAALVRLTNLERRAEAEARLAALCTAHMHAAAAAVAAGAAAAADQAETAHEESGGALLLTPFLGTWLGTAEVKERRAHKRWRDARHSRDARCRGTAQQRRRQRDAPRATPEARREVASRCCYCWRARPLFAPSARGTRRRLACELGGEALSVCVWMSRHE